MSAKKQIRLYCKWCCMDSNIEITKCPSEDCPLWPFREGMSFKGESKQKAIRAKCTDCLQNIRTGNCKEKKCQLFGYREGHRPVVEGHVKKIITPEQIERMQAANPRRKRILGADEKKLLTNKSDSV